MRRSSTTLLEVGAVVVMAGYALALFWAIEEASYDVWGALLVGPFVVLVGGLMISALSRRELDPALGRLLVVGFVLKLVGAVVRYYASIEVYDRSDALAYHQAGAALAEQFRHGDFGIDSPEIIGTTFIEIVTGIIYTVAGPTMIGGFLVFSLLAFIGSYLFYRAFCLALGPGDAKRYLLLVAFLPSMLFWPSSIGKEAWMTLALGLTANGAARLLTRTRGGVPVLAAGLVATALVRPHITLIAFVGLALGYLVRQGTRSSGHPGRRLIGLVAVATVGLVVTLQAESFLGVEDLSPSSVGSVLDQTEDQTTGGNSGFVAPAVESPLDVPFAVVSVLYRPFPWEAHNVQALAASAEGSLLAVLTLLALPRIRLLPRLARTHPYALFAAVFAVLFIVAFSTLGNFGIIVRQRVQLYPFAAVLLCLPRARQAQVRSDDGRTPRVGQAAEQIEHAR